MKPGKFQRNKQGSQVLCWKVHDPAQSFVLSSHTATFLLVSSLGTNHDLLCFVQGQGQTSEQKHRTKNFAKLHNHFFLLTMPILSSVV